MIVDTSAVVAIIRGEPDASEFARALERVEVPPRMSAASFLETAIVIDGSRDPILSRRLDEVMARSPRSASSRSPSVSRGSRVRPYRDFGKGSGHPAGLNFGDCFAYALAKDRGEPLLFKGTDFGHTDIVPAALG